MLHFGGEGPEKRSGEWAHGKIENTRGLCRLHEKVKPILATIDLIDGEKYVQVNLVIRRVSCNSVVIENRSDLSGKSSVNDC